MTVGDEDPTYHPPKHQSSVDATFINTCVSHRHLRLNISQKELITLPTKLNSIIQLSKWLHYLPEGQDSNPGPPFTPSLSVASII